MQRFNFYVVTPLINMSTLYKRVNMEVFHVQVEGESWLGCMRFNRGIPMTIFESFPWPSQDVYIWNLYEDFMTFYN